MRTRNAFAGLLLAAVFAACDSAADGSERLAVVVDDFGDSVRTGPAYRIVSLNPVTTEFLFAVGSGTQLVGRSHWDRHPSAAASVPDLGDGIGPNVEAVLGARPDLVILYASASNRRAVMAFRQAGVRTLTMRTDVTQDLVRFADAYARVTGEPAARTVADTVVSSVNEVRTMARGTNNASRASSARSASQPTVLWRMGDPPLYVAGRGSFMGELIEIAGARNIFGELPEPSPQVSLEEVVRRNPDFILTGPEGLKSMQSSAAWQAVPAVKRGRILVVDTALVGRPGVRLGEAAHHVRRLIFPTGGK